MYFCLTALSITVQRLDPSVLAHLVGYKLAVVLRCSLQQLRQLEEAVCDRIELYVAHQIGDCVVVYGHHLFLRDRIRVRVLSWFRIGSGNRF